MFKMLISISYFKIIEIEDDFFLSIFKEFHKITINDILKRICNLKYHFKLKI